jgi:hypothetical protein
MNDARNHNTSTVGRVHPSSKKERGSGNANDNNTTHGNGGRQPRFKDHSKVPYVSGGRAKSSQIKRVAHQGNKTAPNSVVASLIQEVDRLKGVADAKTEKIVELKDDKVSAEEIETNARMAENELAKKRAIEKYSFATHYISLSSPQLLCLKLVLITLLFMIVRNYIRLWVKFFSTAMEFEFDWWHPLTSIYYLLLSWSIWATFFVSTNFILDLCMSWFIFHFGTGKDLLIRKAVYEVVAIDGTKLHDDLRPEVIALGKVKYMNPRIVTLSIKEDFIYAGVNLTLLSSSLLNLWTHAFVQVTFNGLLLVWLRLVYYQPWLYFYLTDVISPIKAAIRYLPDFSPRNCGTIDVSMELLAQLRSADTMMLSLDQEMYRNTSGFYSEADFYRCHGPALKLQFEKLQYAGRRHNVTNFDRYDFLTGQLYVQNTIKIAQVLYDDLRRIQYVQTNMTGFPTSRPN